MWVSKVSSAFVLFCRWDLSQRRHLGPSADFWCTPVLSLHWWLWRHTLWNRWAAQQQTKRYWSFSDFLIALTCHTVTSVKASHCYEGVGLYYKGTASKTVSGQTCLQWDEETRRQYLHLDINAGKHNYCRSEFGSLKFHIPFAKCWIVGRKKISVSPTNQLGSFIFLSECKNHSTLSSAVLAVRLF